MTSKKTTIVAVSAAIGLAAAIESTAWAGSEIDAGDYQQAQALHESNVSGLVRNEAVEPHWLGGSDRFWYRRDTAAGHRYVVVDATNGDKRPAFDHAELAATLTETLSLETPASANQLPISNVSLAGDLSTLDAMAAGGSISCQLTAMVCTARKVNPPEMGLLPSPDGKHVAFARDDNIFLRDVEDGGERQLTKDGEIYFSYGKLPDASLITIVQRRTGWKLPPLGTKWSPDSRFLITTQTDERDVGLTPFVEWVPQDGRTRPVLYNLKTAQLGDKNQVKSELFIIDTKTGKQIRINIPEEKNTSGMADPIIGWSAKRGSVFLMTGTYGSRDAYLFEVDLVSGEIREVLHEHGEPRYQYNTELYSKPNNTVIRDGKELIWFSERDGWGHLYRYDAITGELINRITSGDWVVFDIIQIDEDTGRIFFTAGGREKNVDPYYRQLYRVELDGSNLTLLTAAAADHEFEGPPVEYLQTIFGVQPGQPRISPSGNYIVDTYSRVDLPPITEIRSVATGNKVAEIESADASALYDAGWVAPQRFKVKAADGDTDIYGALYRPINYEEGKTYPVIDAVYGGPQVAVAPKSFKDAYAASSPGSRSALAALGFVVVTIDGRATPFRNKAYWEVGYPEFTDIGIDDHIAAIRQLAAKNAFMAIGTGVGVYGHSWGGTFSARAILKRPDFYSVAVSSAGVHDYTLIYPGFEPFIGLPSYADGSTQRSAPQEKPKNYLEVDNTELAENLQGHLMLVYGDMDENVPPVTTLDLADALIKANKDFDLVYLPNQTHRFSRANPYYTRRMWDYFVRHLKGVQPPRNFPLEVK